MKPIFLITLCSVLLAEQVRVDLRNPVFRNGVLYTSQGGVIKSDDLRIQAKSIQYFHRVEDGKDVRRIEAEGDLLIQYQNKVFVGSELSFDLIDKTGVIYDARTFSSMWYVGGEEISLHADGSYKASQAFVTSCENKNSSWDLRAHTINVRKDRLLIAERVRFRLLDKINFWLPSFKMNLKKFKGPVFRYYLNWNKGPKIGARYQFYSSDTSSAFGRLEYRWQKGWGGALETQYLPEDKKTTLITRSYAGTDRLFNAVDAQFRYRLQGIFNSETKDQKTHTVISWDKYSDVRMPGDFKTDDFEINTAMKTLLSIHHKEDDFIASLKLRPKVNSFESIKQDLPTFFATTRAKNLGNSKIISSNFIKASYLNFDYSDQLSFAIPNYQTPRIEVYEKLLRPIHFRYLTLSPHLAARGILYGTSPTHTPKALGLLDYGVKANLQGQRHFDTYKHIVEPYLRYKALSRPTVPPSQHYIFSIQDGYEKLQEISLGVRNLLFSIKDKQTSFSSDLYAIAFFSEAAIPQVIPRGYLSLYWQSPSLHVFSDNCYNFRDHVIDFSNTRALWTVNENIALSLESRYRSKFDWRKADRENFILDVTRHQSELIDSPLSDRRITLLSNIFIRFNPFWEMRWESHHGFYRLYKNSPQRPYNEFKIHLYTWLNSSWKLGLYYGYTFHNHFDWTISFKLVKQSF
jgi:hypothetical protein